MRKKTKESFQKKNSGNSLFKRMLLFTCCLFLSITAMHAQTITGVVTDTDKETLIGVSIRVQGTTRATITDLDGAYSIAANANEVLEFSYMGMLPQSVKIGNQTKIDVIMKTDAVQLTEAVVIGYGTAKKRDLTGSIVNIKAEEIAGMPASNPLASIQGKVAGVQIVNTGRPGQDPEVRIRGTNSINGYKPLYVVDGLFTDNINYINPSDIESMDVLKDASSLAIFGVRGANGVIIITTKRAKEGQTLVNINSSIGFKSVNDKISMTNAAQFKELYNEQLINQGAQPFDYTNWQADTDWQKEIFQTGFITNNNVSITGASDKNKFYLGVGYSSEEGSIKSEKFSKITVNLNSDYTVKPWLRFGFQVNGARTLPPDAKSVSSAIQASPIAPTHGIYYNELTKKNETLVHHLPSFQRDQVWNPYTDIELRAAHNLGTNHRVAGNIYGEADILDHFKFRTTYSLDYGIAEARSHYPIIWVYNPDLSVKKENLTTNERINQSKATDLVAQSDYILTYDNKFGKHGIVGTAGITTNYKEYSSIDVERSQNLDNRDFPIPDDPDFWWIGLLGKDSMKNGGSQYRRFTMSYLARALYNYDNRYLFNASYRRDGSSVFRGVGNTWDNFYSFGGGWVASEEKFMQDLKVIDYLKLKGSYGVLGSENTGGSNYPSYPKLANSGSAVFGDNIISGYTYENIVRDLHWEKTYAWEIGFEANLLNQRLRLEPVYYSKRTDGIIMSLPGTHGKIDELQNFGEVENKGFEFSASWSDKLGDTGVRYSIGGNLTTIKNEVLKVSVNPDADKVDPNLISHARKGYPIGYFYGYVVEGVYQNNEDIFWSPENTLGTARPGDLKFKDVDGDGKITTADRTMIGNPTPDFTYGINLNIDYKGFDLGVDMMGVYGNEIYRNWGSSTKSQFNYHTDRLDRWHGEGTSNWEPILDPSRSINMEKSSYFVEDGSFFRIRNVQLGYTFSASLLSKLKLKQLRLYGNIQNLKTWSKNSSFTPESGGNALAFGIDSGSYPMPTIFTFGANVTF